MSYELAKFAGALRNIPPEEILSRNKNHKIAEVRFAIIWALRRLNTKVYSYPRLKSLLGFEDHTSVYYGFIRACIRRDTEIQFRNLTDRLLAFAEARAPYLCRGERIDDLGEAA